MKQELRAVVRVLRRGPTMPGPYAKAAIHRPTLLGKLAMERWISFSRSMPADLKALAQMRASSLVGCVW